MFSRSAIRASVTLAATVLALAAMVLPVSAETSDCYGVQATATTVFDPQIGGFFGVASFRFNGQTVDVPATAYVTGPDTTMHVLETPWGTLTTSDELILVPVDPAAGVFSLRSRLEVVDGGSGKIHLLPQSRIDLANGIASWVGRGHICIGD